MPRKPRDEDEDDIQSFEEDELEELWAEDFEEDFPELDEYFDDIQDWLDHEEDWDEDKYKES